MQLAMSLSLLDIWASSHSLVPFKAWTAFSARKLQDSQHVENLVRKADLEIGVLGQQFSNVVHIRITQRACQHTDSQILPHSFPFCRSGVGFIQYRNLCFYKVAGLCLQCWSGTDLKDRNSKQHYFSSYLNWTNYGKGMQLLNYNCLQNQCFPQCRHVRKKIVLQDCSKGYSIFRCILNPKLLACGPNLACRCVVWSVVCVPNCISCHHLKML